MKKHTKKSDTRMDALKKAKSKKARAGLLKYKRQPHAKK